VEKVALKLGIKEGRKGVVFFFFFLGERSRDEAVFLR
jgi:hypothetical protein